MWHFHIADPCSVDGLSSCQRLRIAGLARAIQMRLPYRHRCSPVYCLKDRPCCRFFYPWPYHGACAMRRRAPLLSGSKLPSQNYEGGIVYVFANVKMLRNIQVRSPLWKALQMHCIPYLHRARECKSEYAGIHTHTFTGTRAHKGSLLCLRAAHPYIHSCCLSKLKGTL